MSNGYRILHLVDSTTSPDAMDVLALLLSRLRSVEGQPVTHQVVMIGHMGIRGGAATAGLLAAEWAHSPSRGWADPTGWRGVSKILKLNDAEPVTHLHAWGMSGIAAASIVRTSIPRFATIADEPTRKQMRLMRLMDSSPMVKGRGTADWQWIATSSTVERHLLSGGLAPERVQRIRPGIAAGGTGAGTSVGEAKAGLGIGPSDGPIILVGGDGGGARHDQGLWAAAILQQIFNHTRAIVRAHPVSTYASNGIASASDGVGGGGNPGLERFRNALPNDRLLIEASASHWRELLPAADLLLYTGVRASGTFSILHAMAAGVPVIVTPSVGASELVEHQHNGLLTTGQSPREIASRLEQFMSDSTLRWPLTDRAKADLFSQFSPTAMVEAYTAKYAGRRAAVETLAGV